jgi:FtsH-binding integral membrane protein
MNPMNPMNPTNPLSPYPMGNEQAVAEENARFMSQVYLWMTSGVILTAIIAYAIGNNESLAFQIVRNRLTFYLLLGAQFGVVLALSFLIRKINSLVAMALYFLYAALTGVTLSVIFIAFTRESIFQVFALTAFMFASLSAVGFFTKKDLSPVGSFCVMGLFGMIGFGLISLFFPSIMGSTASKVYSIVGIIVFSGLTAYDTQKIKQMNVIGDEGTDEDRKEAIFGALTLYLDFINLFLSLLRLMGRRND